MTWQVLRMQDVRHVEAHSHRRENQRESNPKNKLESDFENDVARLLGSGLQLRREGSPTATYYVHQEERDRTRQRQGRSERFHSKH